MTARALCALAAALALARPAASQHVRFENVAVVDLDAGRTVPGQTVVVADGRIVAVGAAGAAPAGAAGARVVDARGLFLMPGLVDMHAHLAVPPGPDDGPPIFLESDRETLARYLAAGVTTIRNLWGSPSALAARRRVASGVWAGPRVVTAGPLVDARAASQQGTPFQVTELARRPTTIRIGTPADAREAVRYHAAAGYDLVKVYNGVPAPAFEALAETAAAFGLPVAGHVPVAVGLAGVLARPGPSLQSVEHAVSFVDAAVSPGAALPDDFLAAELARYTAADTVRVAVWAQAAAARGTAVVPTLGLLARTYGAREDHAALLASIDGAPASKRQRARWRATAERHAGRLDGFAANGLDGDALGRAPLAAGLALTRALHAAGAPILLGTDAPAALAAPGDAVAAELGLLVRAGLAPLDALRAATTAPHSWLRANGLGDARGRVAAGEPADLLLLRADPLRDVAAVGGVEGVVRGGVYRDRAALDALLEAVAAE